MIEFVWDKKQMQELRALPKKMPGLPLHFLQRLTTRTTTIMSRDVLRAGGLLRVRTGLLWKSIGERIIDDGGTLTGIVGSGVRTGTSRVKYANIHVNGGVVKSKSGKYLTIPTKHALTASGDLKHGATSARDFKNTFVQKTKRGTLIIFQSPKTKRSRITVGGYGSYMSKNAPVPLFILKKSVRIPKRDYIGATSERVQREIPALFNASVKRMAKV